MLESTPSAYPRAHTQCHPRPLTSLGFKRHFGPISFLASTDTGRLIQSLIDEPSEAILLRELEDIKNTLSHDTPLTWLIEILTEELWEEEQFQRGDLPLQSAPGLQMVWNHLGNHLGQNQRVTGNTIRSWRLSLTQATCNCSTCQVRKQATCHGTNTSTPITSETNIPSANMHQRGKHCVKNIPGLGSKLKCKEMDLDERDPQTNGPKYSVQSCHERLEIQQPTRLELRHSLH
jgi:hypothetical protein